MIVVEYMSNNILFRADSSSNIGTGHIMRDLVLAEQLEEANITFATKDLPGNINHKIKEKGFEIKILASNDIEELSLLIKELHINMIVIDHYHIGHEFEEQLKIKKPKLKIMVLDDTYEKHHCDILLNHNIYADSSKYKDLVPENCELRCGASFALLRDEFKSEKLKQNNVVQEKKKVFVAMGGADHANLHIRILKVLKEFPNIHASVVTTTANQYLDELQDYVVDKENVTLHINTNHIARLMNESNFAIVTPSVTINELVFMRTPFIAIKTENNQNEMYNYLSKKSVLALENFDTVKLKKSIESLLVNEKIVLVNFIDLSLDEKKMILSWRNHPNIRKWMFTQEPISLDDHLNYLKTLSTKKDRVYFLVRKGGKPIGVINIMNIDMNTKKSKFGIYADPTLKGVGKDLMDSMIDYAFNTLKVEILVSEVFEDNTPAIKLYKRYDFKEKMIKQVNGENIIHMELNNEHRQF